MFLLISGIVMYLVNNRRPYLGIWVFMSNVDTYLYVVNIGSLLLWSNSRWNRPRGNEQRDVVVILLEKKKWERDPHRYFVAASNILSMINLRQRVRCEAFSPCMYFLKPLIDLWVWLINFNAVLNRARVRICYWFGVQCLNRKFTWKRIEQK